MGFGGSCSAVRCVWPGTGAGQQWQSGCPWHEAAPHPVQAGTQMWGVVPHSAWARHVISSLLSQRLNYSRDCFQIISSKFPPCNNRNLIQARARSHTSSLPERHCCVQIRHFSEVHWNQRLKAELLHSLSNTELASSTEAFVSPSSLGRLQAFSFFSPHIKFKQLLSLELFLSIHSLEGHRISKKCCE